MYDRTITPESLIETKGLKRAAVLATLFNAASKVGHGTKDSGPETITEAQAQEILNAHPGKSCFYFEYLYGKRLKIDLTEVGRSGIVAAQYDYGQGRGTAMTAISILKSTGDPCHRDIITLQVRSRAQAAEVSAPLSQSGTVTQGSLAEALDMTDRGTEEEADYNFERCSQTPCTTITL